LLLDREAWVEEQPDATIRTAYRLTRSSIFAFGDRLPEAIAEGRQALQAASATQDWPAVLPAMSNIGLMHYWRGEYAQAHEVLSQARAHRERLYGGRGSGIKIDIHLGAVLHELNEPEAARTMLEGALAEIHTWPDNEYRRTEILLAHNHLAQMWLARGQAEDAARVLAVDATGVAERFYGRRLALRLRWQRLHGHVDGALVLELQALAARLASPFNRALMVLELSRQQPPAEALHACRQLADSAVALQRPGLRLHALALAARAAHAAGEPAAAHSLVREAQALHAQCGPFDMAASELRALLASSGA
jgi:tetratricopeptide (TPR) repeat protein